MTPSGRMRGQLPEDRPHIRIRILGRDWEPIDGLLLEGVEAFVDGEALVPLGVVNES